MTSLRPENSTEIVVNDMDFTVMKGTETYPIIGNLLQQTESAKLLGLCAGLQESAQCLEKSFIVLRNKTPLPDSPKMYLCLGAIRVWSTGGTSSYGHDFNPPREFHSWIEVGNSIIDLALPGVIIRGTRLYDDVGQVLTGRTPVILAGRPPLWLQYKPVQKYS